MANDVIQVNYEALQRMQRDFARCVEETAQMQQRLKNGADRLVGSKWEGAAARQFFNEMDDEVLPAFDRLSKALTGCQEVTAAIIQEFRQAEEEAAALFKKDGDTGSSAAGGGTSGTSTGGTGGPSESGDFNGAVDSEGGSSWGQVSKEDYDWLNWSNRTLGKSVSTLSGSLLKLLGETGKIPVVKGLFDGVSVGVNVFTDEDFQTDKLRAFAGEAGKYLLKEGLKRVIPGVGWAFLISDGLQVVAWLGAGAAAAAGNHGLAKQISDIASYVDLGGYLERAAEWGFDRARDGVNMAGELLSNQANDLLGSLQLSPQGALAY